MQLSARRRKLAKKRGHGGEWTIDSREKKKKKKQKKEVSRKR